jgi:hypothetical protein
MTEDTETPQTQTSTERTYTSAQAAELMIRGYTLGVLLGIGSDSEDARKMYEAIVTTVIPVDVMPHFEKRVMERLPKLIAEMRASVSESLPSKLKSRKSRASQCTKEPSPIEGIA